MTTDHAITALTLAVAAIHLIPVAGVFSSNTLTKLYGIEPSNRDLQILMRHRGMLFGILGAFFAYAAFDPALRPLAFIGAAASLGSLFCLAVGLGDFGRSMRKVIIADVVAATCLVSAVTLDTLAG